MKIAVTGHRPHKLNGEWLGQGPVSDYIRKEMQGVIDTFFTSELVLITGMALGVDQLWAEMAIKNNLRFIAAIPCYGQDLSWNMQNRNRYHELLNNKLCTQFMVNNVHYKPWVMQARNEWMVNNCDMIVAVWDGSDGGTKNCIDYANKQNKPLVKIRLLLPEK